ncbi:MAG: 16S rRNA (cytosine(967)-C(5))-methyltransferase RsmB [Deltaproteobacteria bacterium]|nr:16S rRNA (cytosine(967)-C(5))-methyltransferase RsmB [Deltaproteobacteria bacterium]MBZ0220676.1 16S rRNA (cytosine(967)-C(5))-methyltransferase RsmB [Deltaproteobacteria bacterium]
MAGNKKKKGARDAALSVLDRVEGGAYADILLDAELKGLSVPDAALATELTYGVLRWKLRLDYTIDLFSSIRAAKLERKVLNALRLGAYQLLFLTRVPASAAINESVELVKPDRKRAGFVNAVLRKILSEKERIALPPEDDPIRRISIAWSHPEWMVRRWAERYGLEEAAGICRTGQEQPPRTVRVNTTLTTRERLAIELKNEGFEAVETRYSPYGLEVRGGGALGAKDPRYYIQDEASQLVPILLAPRPGEAVLDACSAPGGKTSHMAQLMENKGIIYALDRHASRLRAVIETASRLGAERIIKIFEADASAPLDFIEEGTFDAILCDAPCSGLGVLRRAPDSKYRRKEEDIKELAGIQARLLENLARYLKRGGRLVYSVCTFEPEETEATVYGFIEKHKEFSVEDASGYLPPQCRELVDTNGFLRTFPHRHGMDGFFAARLIKG